MTSGGPPVLELPDPPDPLPPLLAPPRFLLPSPPPLAAPPLTPVVISSQSPPLRPDLSLSWVSLLSHPHASILQPSSLLASTPHLCSTSPESLRRRQRMLAQSPRFLRLSQPSHSDPDPVSKRQSLSPPSPLRIFQPPLSSSLGEPPPQMVVSLTRTLKSAKSLTDFLSGFESLPWLLEIQLLVHMRVDSMVLKEFVYSVYIYFTPEDMLTSPDYIHFACLRSLTALSRVWLSPGFLQLLSYPSTQLFIKSMNLTSRKPPDPIFDVFLFPEPPVPPAPPEPPPMVVFRPSLNTLVLRVVASRCCSLSPLPPPTASLVASPRFAPWTRAHLQVVNWSPLPIALGLRVVSSRRHCLSLFPLLATGLVATPRSAPWTRAHPQVVFTKPLPLQGFMFCMCLPWFVVHLPQYEVPLPLHEEVSQPLFEVSLPLYEDVIQPLPLYEDVTQPLFEVPLPLYEDVTKPLISVSVNSFVLLIVLSDETGLHSRKLRDELTNAKLGSVVSELVWWVRISSQFPGSSKRCLVISVAILLAASKALVAAVCSGNEAPSVSLISEDFIPLSTFDVIISSCFSVMFISIFYLYVSRYALVATVDLAFSAFVCSLSNNYSIDGE